MADRKIIMVLKALEWLQNIKEDYSGTESDTALDTDVYNLHENNRNNSESESSSDNELIVSESSNSKILDFEHTKTSSEPDVGIFCILIIIILKVI